VSRLSACLISLPPPSSPEDVCEVRVCLFDCLFVFKYLLSIVSISYLYSRSPLLIFFFAYQFLYEMFLLTPSSSDCVTADGVTDVNYIAVLLKDRAKMMFGSSEDSHPYLLTENLIRQKIRNGRNLE